MSLPDIDVIIVNYNGAEDTLACVQTLRSQHDVRTNLWIVDNGSRDGSVDLLRKEAPDAHLIISRSNLGFAGGYNLGIRTCLEYGAGFILIINNDTLADQNMLSEMIKVLTPGVGAVAPVIFYADSPHKIWSQGGKINWVLMDVINHHGRKDTIPVLPVQKDFLSGCCLLVTRDTLEKVGLFDENFFLYYEDLDWSIRLKNAGLCGMIAPAAKLWHKVSQASGGKNSRNERYWHARSSIYYFRKYVNGWCWIIVLPWRTASALRTSINLFFRREWTALHAYWRGIRDGLQTPYSNQ